MRNLDEGYWSADASLARTGRTPLGVGLLSAPADRGPSLCRSVHRLLTGCHVSKWPVHSPWSGPPGEAAVTLRLAEPGPERQPAYGRQDHEEERQ